MTVAYVLEQGSSIKLEGERLIVQKGKSVLHALHLFKLDQLVVFGNVSITPPAIKRLLSDKIDTVFMSRNGHYQGRLQPPWSKNITLRCEQFEKLRNEEFCLKAATEIVRGKVGNMRAILLRLNRNREDLELDDHVLQLKLLMKKIAGAESIDSVRGFEGRASALYFDGFSRGFIAEGVHFEKRMRRPPKDPVNALLSLGYMLLFNVVMSAVSLVGFDPYLGSLHALDYGRPSLVLDLMEEWRSVIVDSLVLGVFNLKSLTLDDFTRGQDLPVKLTDTGFRKFIIQFERKLNQKITHHLTGQQLSYRDCIREQVRHFARVIRGEEDRYQPMILR
nr:CRISPR-associated endonuclease Cas1 [Desulfobacterales bacterium]